MRGGGQIEAAIRAANREGRPALAAFLTAGFPHKEEFAAQLASVAAAADLVEIGVPFSDPMADGATIQKSSRAALEQGVTLAWILRALAAQKERPRAPLLLMSYLNPLLSFGLARLPAAARDAGIAGFIVPDLPFEEARELRSALSAEEIALVQMAAPLTPPERLARLCADAEGFVYAVAMLGATGGAARIGADMLAYLDRVRAVAPVPVCAGFGIRTKEQLARLAGHVDGVVVGSALVEAQARGEDPAEFLRALRAG